MEQFTIRPHFYQEFILGLLPIEWVLEEDFELSGSSPAGRELAGAQGGIPPGAGHPEAAVLPSGRVGNEFGCPRLSWDSVLGEGFGERCLAEAGQALRNPGFFPPRLSCPGRDAPLGLCDRVVFSFLTHSIGRRPFF